LVKDAERSLCPLQPRRNLRRTSARRAGALPSARLCRALEPLRRRRRRSSRHPASPRRRAPLAVGLAGGRRPDQARDRRGRPSRGLRGALLARMKGENEATTVAAYKGLLPSVEDSPPSGARSHRKNRGRAQPDPQRRPRPSSESTARPCTESASAMSGSAGRPTGKFGRELPQSDPISAQNCSSDFDASPCHSPAQLAYSRARAWDPWAVRSQGRAGYRTLGQSIVVPHLDKVPCDSNCRTMSSRVSAARGAGGWLR